jgi:hypothetical protein
MFALFNKGDKEEDDEEEKRPRKQTYKGICEAQNERNPTKTIYIHLSKVRTMQRKKKKNIYQNRKVEWQHIERTQTNSQRLDKNDNKKQN